MIVSYSYFLLSITLLHTQAPNIRTVGIERVTQQGIDFVLKRGTKVADVLTKGQELSFLHTAGLFLPGQSAEQWRGEGTCQAIPLGQVIDEVPHFIITSMVGSKRIAAESTGGWPVDESADSPLPTLAKIRESIQNRSHLTEIMQKTRLELENGDVTLEELEDCITALRLQPTRLECMWASPDSSVVWERWEWQRETLTADGTLTWRPPRNLVPH